MSESELRMEESLGCPLCGSHESTHVDSCDDALVKKINRSLPPSAPRFKDIRNFRRICALCGLLYLSPRLDEASLSKIYDSWYSCAYRRVMTDEQHIVDRLREFSQHHFRVLRSAMTLPGRLLLDVGCGNGLFMQVARESGWDVVGIEWDGKTATAGSSRFGLDIRQGTLHNALSENEQFDAIALFDYLEHSRTPGRDIDQLCTHLRNGGVLLTRVPNLNGWQSRLMGCHWLGVISNHMSYFSKDVLCRAIETRGLTVESISASNYLTEFEIFRQRWRWMRQRLGITNSAATPLSGAQRVVVEFEGGATAALGRWIYSLLIEQIDHIGGWFDQGNNLMVVARKKT